MWKNSTSNLKFPTVGERFSMRVLVKSRASLTPGDQNTFNGQAGRVTAQGRGALHHHA